MQEQPVVSVIIPVYNSSSTIEKCIQSLQEQTFANFEILAVDDGSSDESLQILKQLAKTDPRIRSFAAPHGGVCSARNYGLDRACGKWITFIDSDDTVSTDFLSHHLKALEEADGVYTIFWPRKRIRLQRDNQVEQKEQKESADRNSLQEREEPADWKVRHELGEGECVTMPVCAMTDPIILEWQAYIGGKFFLRELVEENQIRFPMGLYYAEDTLFAMQYLCCCKPEQKVILCNNRDYHYRYSPGGLRRQRKNKLDHMGLLRMYLTSYASFMNLKADERSILCGWWNLRKMEMQLDMALGEKGAAKRYRMIRKAFQNPIGRSFLRTKSEGQKKSAYEHLILLGHPGIYFLHQERKRLTER